MDMYFAIAGCVVSVSFIFFLCYDSYQTNKTKREMLKELLAFAERNNLDTEETLEILEERLK